MGGVSGKWVKTFLPFTCGRPDSLARALIRTYGHVALVILRDAAHPAESGVGRVAALLVDVGRAQRHVPNLVPARRRLRARIEHIHDQGVVRPKVAIREAVHQPVGQRWKRGSCR